MVIRDKLRPGRGRGFFLLAGLALMVALLLIAACGDDAGEDRPGIEVIDTPSGSVSVSASGTGTGTGSATGTVTGSATGTGSGTGTMTATGTMTGSASGTGTGTMTGSATGTGSGTGTMTGTVTGTGTATSTGTGTATGTVTATGTGMSYETDKGRGLWIPVGQEPETEGPTKSDGYYTATTNREIYQKISSDYQEIVKLTNVIKEGHPLPAAEIWLMYEAGIHTRLGNQSRTLRSFAAGTTPGTYFPDSVEFYGSARFLDSPISNAVRGRGEAENYSDAQKRQAINKSAIRIIYHWAKFYMIIGVDRMSSRLIDEAWAVYVGEEVDGGYPNSLAATAQSREGNFGREGTIDVPLRQAMDRARQAADDMDEEALATATQEVYSRFNAIFYLSTVRYIGSVHNDAEAGDHDNLGTHQVEALSFYRSIQPEVAKADAAADETIVAYLVAEADQITTDARDEALTALNRTASALLLTQDDLVTSYE